MSRISIPIKRPVGNRASSDCLSPTASNYNIRLAGDTDLVRKLEIPDPSRYGPATGSPSPLGGGSEEENLVQRRPDGECYIKDSPIGQFNEVHYESQGALGFEGSASAEKVTLAKGYLKGRINYSLDYEITDPVLVYRSRGGVVLQPLEGSIQDGATDFDFGLRTSGTGTLTKPSNERSRKAAMLRNVLWASESRRPGLWSQDEILLAGWREGSNDRALESPLTKSVIEETLVLVHIPLQIDSSDSPLSSADGSIIALQAKKTQTDDKGSLIMIDGNLTYAVTMPSPDNSSIPRLLHVTVHGSGSANPPVSSGV